MVPDSVINVERAKNFTNILKNGDIQPVDVGDIIELRLPSLYDREKIKNAQRFFRCNFYAMMFAMYLGVLSVLSIPSILNVLIHTNKSSSNVNAYKRYMRTIYHTLSWFRHDLTPGTKAWKSLEAVRKFHFSADRSAKHSNVGSISQKDMAITQFGFMGFVVLSQKQLGIQGSAKDLEDFCYFWKVLGTLVGIRDEYNLCCETFEETRERLEIVQHEFFTPNLTNPPNEFEIMTKYIVNGLRCFDPFDSYNEIIFMLKRLSGVPNYFYLNSEIPENYERENLEIYKYSYWDRFVIWLGIMTRQFLLRFFIIRWFFNGIVHISEFLIRYFPIIAFFKFGYKNSYVDLKT
ncbi:CLUMA_CG003857, isoform A [Clunio marinus]|uniref:CLUMA_CG003857, isoform A n=1 Tax=Clunio marinus TaxID=568069 RepID=A0A1J1HQ27_9DIPT|nr:CLUMA_CG003857, isoform A [Clunio marinus]